MTESLSTTRAADSPSLPQWAQPGAKLIYSIADFDAEDEYTFEVLAASGGLSLGIRMGSQVVAAEARFTEQALLKAASNVTLSQGGADVDLGKAQTKALPPILISRAALETLLAGKSLTWKGIFGAPSVLASPTRQRATIQINGHAHPVPALLATSDEAALAVLADPVWPLVISIREADCFIELRALELPREHAQSPAPAARPRAGKSLSKAPSPGPSASPIRAAGVRRLEQKKGDGGSFWEARLDGEVLVIRYGKIGAAPFVKKQPLASVEAAERERERLIREKLKKGFVEV